MMDGMIVVPKQAKELSAIEISRLQTPGVYFVGCVPGLALRVSDTKAKYWFLRCQIASKRRDIGIGGYPSTGLADARKTARDLKDKIRHGTDPIQERKAALSLLVAQQQAEWTFDACVKAYISAHELGWKNAKHASQWRNTLTEYASSKIGKLLARDVQTSHVVAILEPIWATKTETAKRLRGRIELVLDWAKTLGYRSGENPARWRGHLENLLARPSKITKRSNFKAVPVDEAPSFYKLLSSADGTGAAALRFAFLTAARSGEVRNATWDEFDLENAIWIVPGSRMKAGREHRVPLQPEAVEIIKRQPKIAEIDLVFSSAKGTCLSDMTLSAVMRRMKVDAVPHGLRSTFRDWVAEKTAFPGDLAEMALAHIINSKVEAAYRRGDMFERRRELMNAWGSFLYTTSIK